MIVNKENTIDNCIGNTISDIIEPLTKRVFSPENKLNNVFSEICSKKIELEFIVISKHFLVNIFPKLYANLYMKKEDTIIEPYATIDENIQIIMIFDKERSGNSIVLPNKKLISNNLFPE